MQPCAKTVPVVVVLWIALFILTVGQATGTTITYTDPTLFQAAITTQTTTTFDSFANNTVLGNGTVINGATYNFNIAGGFTGLATNFYQAVSTPNTLGVNRSTTNPFANDFFFAGDSVTLTFAQPTQAIGAYFSSNSLAGNAQGFISISTPLGTASSGNALPTGTFGFPSNVLRFVGVSSDQPFSTATLKISNPSPGNVGFVTDNITVGMPKTTQDIYHLSLNSLSSLDLTNPLSQNLGINIMDTSLTTARSLSGPLLPISLSAKTGELLDLGDDVWGLVQLLHGVIEDPFNPFFILPCDPNVFTCLFPGSGQEFPASLNEIFDFNLDLQVTAGERGAFNIGDRYFLNSPIFSDQTFSIASVVGISASPNSGFDRVTFNFQGVSELSTQAPEPSTWILMLAGLFLIVCISYTKSSLHEADRQ
jgi:hypothetical protein